MHQSIFWQILQAVPINMHFIALEGRMVQKEKLKPLADRFSSHSKIFIWIVICSIALLRAIAIGLPPQYYYVTFLRKTWYVRMESTNISKKVAYVSSVFALSTTHLPNLQQHMYWRY